MIPETRSEMLFSGIPLMETSVPLAASTAFPAGTATVDILDLLRTEQSENFFVSGNRYVYEPLSADPRWYLYYSIYAEGAGGVPAPGDLLIWVQCLDTTAVNGAQTTTVALDQNRQAAYHVPYSGQAMCFQILTGATIAELKAPTTGKIQIEGRQIIVQYVNAFVAQTVFQLTVSLRPI